MQITDSPRRSPNPLDTATRRLAATLITTYQKQLSPRKGFSCAYRVLHCSESCSQYTKRMILALGFGEALPLIRQRFQACKAANQTLKAHGCRSTRSVTAIQPDVRSTPSAIAPVETRSRQLSPQSWLAIGDEPLDDALLGPPDENSEPGEPQPDQRRTGGGSFRKPPVSDTVPTDGNSSNTSCPDAGCDSLECASFGCDAIDCSSADWSATHCGAADCSGLDCSGLDCGSLDCSSCDVGSCDCSS